MTRTWDVKEHGDDMEKPNSMANVLLKPWVIATVKPLLVDEKIKIIYLINTLKNGTIV
jgi:hypothetical protein